MKFIGKTIVAAVKVYAVCALVNHISYLDYKVKELETEVGKLKEGAEG